MAPKVSIIIPVYNKAPFIKEALDSVISQKFEDVEIVIIDDGSTDGSQEIIKSYSEKKINFIQNEKNSGPAAIANKLIDISTGEFIVRFDADDIMPSDRILLQLKAMNDNPDVGIVSGVNQRFGDVNDKLILPLKWDEIRQGLFFRNTISQPACMIRRDSLIRSKARYDEKGPRVGEDWLFFYKFCKTQKAVNLPEVLNHYRWHGENLSSGRGRNYYNDIKMVVEYILSDLGIPHKETDVLAQLLFRKQFLEEMNDESFIEHFHKWQNKLIETNNRINFVSSNFLAEECKQSSDFLFYRIAENKKLLSAYKKFWPMSFGKYRYLISARLKGK